MSAEWREGNIVTYLERHFEKHGELEGVLYCTKREGGQELSERQKQNWDKQAEAIWI